ncbi:hypothetical protein [Epinotia aporema granulovirus]|uniref:Uncharacterized protein n=1 Tax=Epinotia aporema granulovirus TaxID=166056 RepID=K4EQF7_9BBAC|nr:hypothetical protein [Epinotia aporema granulovirus]AER41548.1 hypothetical protein [Epinotia aporema granulovirus]
MATVEQLQNVHVKVFGKRKSAFDLIKLIIHRDRIEAYFERKAVTDRVCSVEISGLRHYEFTAYSTNGTQHHSINGIIDIEDNDTMYNVIGGKIQFFMHIFIE